MHTVLQSLFVLGSSHQEAPLELRERFALSREEREALQQAFASTVGIRECLILNTCNRLEIYGLADGDGASLEAALRDALCELKALPREQFDAHSFFHTNLKVVEHALAVASGIESQMIGETEILGQMKAAYAEARDSASTRQILNRLFEKSFQTAKAIRTQTGITRGQISIGNVAVDLATRIFGRLDRSRVLLLGSGEVGEKTAQALKSRGAADIAVSSRTFENAHRLAHELGGSAIDFADFIDQLEHYDIVICATAAPGTLLDKETVGRTLRRRPERPLFLIDLAMPRDIHPEVGQLENVYLYNLDDLSTIANENLSARRAEIEQARQLLRRQAWTLWLQLRRRELMRGT